MEIPSESISQAVTNSETSEANSGDVDDNQLLSTVDSRSSAAESQSNVEISNGSQQATFTSVTYLPPLLSSLSSRVETNDVQEEVIPLSATLPAEETPAETTTQLSEATTALSSFAFECQSKAEKYVRIYYHFPFLYCVTN